MAAPADATSFLLVEEYFAHEDARFVESLRSFGQPGKLAGLAERWRNDPRPWARAQILNYLDQPMDRQGHQVVVKRLFKHAEAQGDAELMPAFLAAFDRLVRRQRRTRYRWDSQFRTSFQEEELFAPRNTLKGNAKAKTARNPRTGQVIQSYPRLPRNARLFTYHTRYYLQRRAWRWFRSLARRRPQDYVQAARAALLRFRDEDLAAGEHLLDSWSLMHLCFGEHDAVEFDNAHARLKEGRSMGELQAAPAFPELWKAEGASRALVDLAVAPARTVRVWAMHLLRTLHKDRLAALGAAAIKRLLDHDDEEVQQFGAELLTNASGLEKLPVTEWLELLTTRNLTALETVCACLEKHVTPGRLTLVQGVELACARPAPVARLGLRMLKQRTISTPEEREKLAALAGAACAAAGAELAAWALGILGAAGAYKTENALAFFDSLLLPVRAGAWAWLKPESPGWNDALLWSRLTESPHDDVRLKLVETLERRTKLPSGRDGLPALWCTVLLNVHRGGRQKGKAIRQIGAEILRDPAQAETLLPVLSVALRSVRLPECRAALAAVVGAVEAHPALAGLVARLLPELELEPIAPAAAIAGGPAR